MALNMKVSAGSDEEEDLEFLRLAALKSLKKTTNSLPAINQQKAKPTFGSAQTTRHRGFRGNNRAGRNGFGRGRPVNTNLISIRTVEESEPIKENVEEVPKLVLPQDRYHKKEEILDEKEAASNKFDRYDNSGESDSESDEEKRSGREDSLERLMDLLEDEINERTDKPKEKKSKPQKSELKKPETTSDKKNAPKTPSEEPKSTLGDPKSTTGGQTSGASASEDPKDVPSASKEPQTVQKPSESLKSESKSSEKLENESVLILEAENELDQEDLIDDPVEKPKEMPQRRSPSPRFDSRRSPTRRKVYKSRSPENFRRTSRSPPRKKPYLDYPPEPYTSRRSPPRNYNSDLFRPLSPLHIDQSVFSLTQAPLSPRSAAFVLKNREILARRKMSPRNNSLSPSPRRSLSPRRNFSPRRRSRSPRFKRSRSPRSRSPRNSPRRRSLSPKRCRRSPNRFKKGSRSPVNKIPVHKRLGAQQSSPLRDPIDTRRKNRSMSLSLSPSPDRSYNRQPLNETTGVVKDRNEKRKRSSPEKELDPVLEARRRKFENPVTIEPNKTIKLNVNKKDATETDEVDGVVKENDEREEEIDDLIELNPTIDDLWSENESDTENEGRFKTATTQKRTVTCLPFAKLTEKPKPILLTSNQRNDKFERKRHLPKDTHRSRIKSDLRENVSSKRSKITKTKPDKEIKKKIDKDEIRIEKEEKPIEDKKDIIRKVEIPKETVTKKNKDPIDDDLEDDDTEIIIEFDEEDEEKDLVGKEKKEKEENKDDDGDLRAELSRRRAQRLHKPQPTDSVQARLLSTALKDVGMKRSTKSSKTDKSMVSGTITDRKVLLVKSSSDTTQPTDLIKKKKDMSEKLPIHMRLGLNSTNKEVIDDDDDDDLILMERQTRKSKKRRKPIQV